MRIVTNIIGLLSVGLGIGSISIMVSDIQLILGAVLILGGLNLMKGCTCNNENNQQINGNIEDTHNATK